MKKMLMGIILFVGGFAQAADFVVQVQSTAKTWKVKNGSTVVATLERDPSGSVTQNMNSSSPYYSTLVSGLKINGTASNTPQKVFILRRLDFSLPNGRVLYDQPGCSGQPHTAIDMPLDYLDGVYNLDSKYVYVNPSAVPVSNFSYQSVREGMSGFGCMDMPGTVMNAYPLSECTVATCGFDESSTLKLFLE